MSDFQIEEFVTETPANPYTDAVAALIGAGEGKALSITVPRGTKRQTEEEKAAGTEPTPGNGGADRLKFQQAANAAGYTARVRKEEVQEDGQIKLTFTLTQKHNRGAKPKSETAPVVEDTDSMHVAEEVPADETPAETNDESTDETSRFGRRGNRR